MTLFEARAFPRREDGLETSTTIILSQSTHFNLTDSSLPVVGYGGFFQKLIPLQLAFFL